VIDSIDDSAFSLGMPTRLEMYKHQCTLLEVELAEAYTDVQNGRRRIAQLVVMTDQITRERDALQAELARLQDAR
jgi:cell division protein FtsB